MSEEIKNIQEELNEQMQIRRDKLAVKSNMTLAILDI